jgi:vancomycin resistance protein YoaR
MAKRYLIVATIFFILPFATRAEEINLGNFSISDVQKIIGAPINFHFGDQKFSPDKDTLLSWLKLRPALNVQRGYNSEAENINYFPTTDPKLQIYFRFVTSTRERYHTKISNNIALDTDALRNYLEKAKNDFRIDPIDAKLSFEAGKISAFSLSRNGSEINVEKSFLKIEDNLKQNAFVKDINLESSVIKPEITSADLDKYGIKELIGEGVSNFRASPKNRIHNITVGAAKFDGVLIKPGEEFSFIETLGPVDESTGYLPELVIKVDKTIPEFGGGMCQVSTTMFRAALNTGLQITARTNHAYPVSYYNPQGLDATVYIPKPDLKFINDTPNYILVQTRIEGTQLFFDFYGTGDGRETKIIGPTITEKNSDGSMKAVAYQEVYDANGNLIRKDTFKSNYDSPDKYPHPGQEQLTQKPDNWSKKQWSDYKKAHGM